MTNIDIKLDNEANRFIANVENKDCVLEFRKIDDDHLEYHRTFVPEELRHHGIASKLAKHALDHAKKNNMKVVPTCSFVEDFIEQHDEYKTLADK